MTIMTVELRGRRGFGDAGAAMQGALNTLAVRDAQNALLVHLPAMPEAVGSGSGYVDGSVGGDFISTYGIPIGAGVAGLAVGLVIAKLARRRK